MEVNTFNDNFIGRLQCAREKGECGISGNQNSFLIGDGRMTLCYEPCYLLNF